MSAVIGIDLDGTFAQYDGWKGPTVIGCPLPGAVEGVRQLYRQGHILCLWTTRPTYMVEQYLVECGVRQCFTYINDSPYPTDDRKCSFDIYLGDEAVRFNGDWGDAVQQLNKLSTRWWGTTDKFDRDTVWASLSPTLYYQGTGRMYVDMFEQAFNKLWEDRDIPTDKVAFLTICSHAKPYAKSMIHGNIRKALWEADLLDQVDYIHLSNAGIIPHEAGFNAPFSAYDWDGQGSQEVTAYHKAQLSRRLHRWLVDYGRQYRAVFAYLRDGGNTQGIAEPLVPLHYWAQPGEPLPYMHTADPDDCLIDSNNLYKMTAKLKGVFRVSID